MALHAGAVATIRETIRVDANDQIYTMFRAVWFTLCVIVGLARSIWRAVTASRGPVSHRGQAPASRLSLAAGPQQLQHPAPRHAATDPAHPAPASSTAEPPFPLLALPDDALLLIVDLLLSMHAVAGLLATCQNLHSLVMSAKHKLTVCLTLRPGDATMQRQLTYARTAITARQGVHTTVALALTHPTPAPTSSGAQLLARCVQMVVQPYKWLRRLVFVPQVAAGLDNTVNCLPLANSAAGIPDMLSMHLFSPPAGVYIRLLQLDILSSLNPATATALLHTASDHLPNLTKLDLGQLRQPLPQGMFPRVTDLSVQLDHGMAGITNIRRSLSPYLPQITEFSCWGGPDYDQQWSDIFRPGYTSHSLLGFHVDTPLVDQMISSILDHAPHVTRLTASGLHCDDWQQQRWAVKCLRILGRRRHIQHLGRLPRTTDDSRLVIQFASAEGSPGGHAVLPSDRWSLECTAYLQLFCLAWQEIPWGLEHVELQGLDWLLIGGDDILGDELYGRWSSTAVSAVIAGLAATQLALSCGVRVDLTGYDDMWWESPAPLISSTVAAMTALPNCPLCISVWALDDTVMTALLQHPEAIHYLCVCSISLQTDWGSTAQWPWRGLCLKSLSEENPEYVLRSEVLTRLPGPADAARVVHHGSHIIDSTAEEVDSRLLGFELHPDQVILRPPPHCSHVDEPPALQAQLQLLPSRQRFLQHTTLDGWTMTPAVIQALSHLPQGCGLLYFDCHWPQPLPEPTLQQLAAHIHRVASQCSLSGSIPASVYRAVVAELGRLAQEVGRPMCVSLPLHVGIQEHLAQLGVLDFITWV